MFAGKKSAQIREILISESAWEEMTCLFAPSLSAALETAIRKEIEKGHTYTTQACLRPYLTKLLKDKELVTEAFKAGHNKAQYILNPDTGSYHPTAQLL